MNSTLSWSIFGNVPIQLRDRISSVFVFGRNGDKLIFFTDPTLSRSTPLATPVPHNTPTPENSNGSSLVPVQPVENNPDIVAGIEINDSITNKNSPVQSKFSELTEAYCFGRNTACCLGSGEITSCIDTCTKIEAFSGRKVIEMVSGENLHVLALTEDGHVFGWGENRDGQIGNGLFDERVAMPMIIFDPHSFINHEKVVQIAVGASHSVCLLSSGRVYAWGSNELGQLGDGSKVNRAEPIPIEGAIEEARIIQLACCQRTTLALDDRGKVFQWGNNWNDNGVGLGQPVPRPQDLTNTYSSIQSVRVTKLACGANHVIALAESGAVYTWGRNDTGQLGLGFIGDFTGPKPGRDVAVIHPTKISEFSSRRVRIKSIMAHNQMNLSMAQSFSGLVFIWGLQPTTGSVTSRPALTKFKNLESAFVSACGHPISPNLFRIDHELLGNPVVGSPNWLRQMFDHRPTSDLEIIVQGRSIYVHRAVLKMGSAHFRAMLDADNGWKESKSPNLKIDSIPYATYRAYLFYLYADELILPPDINQEDVVALMDLASSYFEEDLKMKTIDCFASKWLDIDNAAAIYTLAIDHMLNELAAVAMEFIFENLTAVVTSPSFEQLDAEHAKTIFIKAAHRNLFGV